MMWQVREMRGEGGYRGSGYHGYSRDYEREIEERKENRRRDAAQRQPKYGEKKGAEKDKPLDYNVERAARGGRAGRWGA